MVIKTTILKACKTSFACVVMLLMLLVITDNTYILRGIGLTYMQGQKTANIDDYTDFDNREIKATDYQEFPKHEEYGSFQLSKKLTDTLAVDTTAAFMVLKDGKLLYEMYGDGYSADSHTNSFSMAKSMTTMLYLKAVEDGYISSYDAPITELLPEYADNKYAQECTLADLSAMTAGFDWSEDYYLPLNPTAKAYYGEELEKQILDLDFIKPCGEFEYLSGVTQLLGIALTRALEPHGYTVSSYFEKSFWQPLGMKNNAYWSLDGSAKIEKFYCCVNASAVDFAKFGQLLLDDGKWNGQQLLSPEHVKLMVTPNASGVDKGEYIRYGYSIWTDMKSKTPFYGMLGHLGQRVVVVPDQQLVIVRLGHTYANVEKIEGYNIHREDVAFYVDEVSKSVQQMP